MPDITVIEAHVPNGKAEKSEARKRRVAGYARVSTDKDEQFSSYEAQVEYYTRFIEAHGDWELAGIYTDEGITGTSTKRRTGFRKMVRDALGGKIDLIVTKSVSRFARNTVDSLTAIRKLKENGTEVYFEKENIWTFDGKGELLITIMSSLAQEESRSISENVTWGMREGMRQGKAWVPYKVFLGYEKGPDGGMVIQPEQAAIVRRIYGMYLQGHSPYHIGQILEKEGVEFSEGRKKWYASTISSILRNEKYKGDALRQKTYSKDFLTKERVPNNGELQQYYISGHHEAIVSPELFDRVQWEIRKRGLAETSRGGRSLFSRRVRCADCGKWFSEVIWAPSTPYEKPVWRCSSKYDKGKQNCAPPAVTADELKAAYIKALTRYLEGKEGILKAFEAVKDELYTDRGFRAEKAELLGEIRLMEEAFETAYSTDLDRINARLDVAEQRLAEVEREIELIRLQKNEMECYMQEISLRDSVPLEFDKETFCTFVDYMTVVSHEEIFVTFKDGTKVRS